MHMHVNEYILHVWPMPTQVRKGSVSLELKLQIIVHHKRGAGNQISKSNKFSQPVSILSNLICYHVNVTARKLKMMYMTQKYFWLILGSYLANLLADFASPFGI